MPSEPKLPSEVEFASFLVYNPRAAQFPSEVSARSRRVCSAVKRDTLPWCQKHQVAERLKLEFGEELRARFLPETATLVPMPGHAPMKDGRNSHWPSRDLCAEFVRVGLGARWLPLLSRTVSVPKAAFSLPGERPAALTHFESLEAAQDLTAGSTLTVVDDVITRGATMVAAVARLKEAYPNATIRGFALIRTMSAEPILAVKAPCGGVVRLLGEGTHREP